VPKVLGVGSAWSTHCLDELMNYREANRSRSKADFANKIKICESEASETVYWLELISEFDWLSQEKVQDIREEANEILAIFTSIGKNLKL
jgi:four helix bundle protein